MSKILFSLVLFMGLLTVDAYSLENYAVVDLQRVVQGSRAFQSFEEQINKHRADLQKEFEAEAKKIQDTKTQLDKKQQSTSPDQYNKELQDLQARVEALNNKAGEKQRSLETKASEAMATINDKALDSVTALAKEDDYDTVFFAGAMPIFDSNKDITNEVLNRLNKDLPRITVSKP